MVARLDRSRVRCTGQPRQYSRGVFPEDDEEPKELTLKLLQVAAAPGDDPSQLRLVLETTRGPIEGLFHPVEGGTAALVCVGGAMGGLDGPGQGLYGRLPEALGSGRVSVLRLNYQQPNVFDECVVDVLAGR